MFRRSLTVALVLSLAALLLSPLANAAPRTAAGRTASADDPNPPAITPKLVFIHHSCGENWLADGNGNLGITLRDNNYFVSDTNYGWGPDGIGNNTDIGNWWDWFRGPQSSTYTGALYSEYGQNCSYSRRAVDPGGENEIVMFKSCYPNSALSGSLSDPVPSIDSNPLKGGSGPLTVANCRGIYMDILNYFRTRPDKLFIVVTAPPMRSLPDGGAPDRAFNNWLVNDWLAGYPYSNVFVFDFYNVLTSNGGSADTNDLGQEGGNHHRWWSNAIQHKTDGGSNVLAYPSDGGTNDHPSAAGNQKASGEFAALLNVAYHRFKVSPTAPRITSISPTSAHPPATVAIDGFRFGATRGGSFVSFNGTHATGYTWSDTHITCTAPAGVTSGPVTVTTSNGTSNEALFTVANQTWYLAEGCTGANSDGSFETWILVQNPGGTPANVDLIFQIDSGQVHGPQEAVPARSRKSYRANDYVTSFNVSTKVNADRNIVCERAMYGNGRTWAHDSIGTTTPSTDWYLAEGCTNGGYETWVLVQNPGTAAANVALTYMTETGQVTGPTALIPPNSRMTFFVADTVNNEWSVSTRVTADSPVVAERAMYGNGRTWAHESIGATAPAADWFLPEGCTRGDFKTWVLVQNPGGTPADINMVFQTDDGQVQGPRETLPAHTRKTYDAHEYVDSWNVSTRVSATSGQVVCERAVYGNGQSWAHDSIGATTPAATWYMAEGCTAGDFETWVLVQNPGSTPANIDMVFQTDSGQVQGPREQIPARTRKTYNLRDYVNSYNVSTLVTATSGQVVCERAMYGNGRTWADDSIGYTP
jgi:IPT/TIG domain